MENFWLMSFQKNEFFERRTILSTNKTKKIPSFQSFDNKITLKKDIKVKETETLL